MSPGPGSRAGEPDSGPDPDGGLERGGDGPGSSDLGRLRELEAELSGIVYAVSHDLQAPLRQIDGFVTLLRRRLGDALDEKARRHLEAIAEAAGRMGRLIDELVVLSDIGRASMASAVVDMATLARTIADEVVVAEAGGREVDVSIGDLPPVAGDRDLLAAALRRLVSNAVKFSRGRSPAQVEVGARPDVAGRVAVFVRDNGAGFDPRQAGRLFAPFQRLHRPDEYEGIGVGLALVRRVVARHGGRVWAEGEPGAGATFFLSLATAPRTG